MSFGAVAVAAAGIGAVGSAGAGLYAADQAGDAAGILRKDLRRSAREVDEAAQTYVDFLTQLDNNFDPYDMEQAFNSLYEAVIMPMERDFNENVLPGIQAAYSGGVLGASAGLSGAAQEAESNARRDLSENKAQLRFQERDKAIARNYAEYERRANLAGQKFSAETAAPMLRANQAPIAYESRTNTIAAQLAANQSVAQIPLTLVGGYQRGQSIRLMDTLNNKYS